MSHHRTPRVTFLERHRRTLLAVAVAAATVALLALGWGDQRAAAERRPMPTVGSTSSTSVRCTVILTDAKGTLYGCSNGTVRWEPKPKAQR